MSLFGGRREQNRSRSAQSVTVRIFPLQDSLREFSMNESVWTIYFLFLTAMWSCTSSTGEEVDVGRRHRSSPFANRRAPKRPQFTQEKLASCEQVNKVRSVVIFEVLLCC